MLEPSNRDLFPSFWAPQHGYLTDVVECANALRMFTEQPKDATQAVGSFCFRRPIDLGIVNWPCRQYLIDRGR